MNIECSCEDIEGIPSKKKILKVYYECEEEKTFGRPQRFTLGLKLEAR
jgi:hypothetical protein